MKEPCDRPGHKQVHLTYAGAVLSDDSAAGRFYADLVGQDLTRGPWARARAGLAYGRWLRRQHRHAEANKALRQAEASFSTIEAAAWAASARRELSATAAGTQADGSGPPTSTVR